MQNRYSKLVETIFLKKYIKGSERVDFKRVDFETTSQELGITLPKNLGDIIYSFKYRTALPDSITKLAPEGKEWVIKNVGRSEYSFVATTVSRIIPDPMLITIKIPDATPGIVQKFALSDEQALLTKLRYNRLLDIFTGVTCYSLQNHLRTTVPGVGQVETDEIYVGIDSKGRQYVFPLQAKGGTDELGAVQIEQDILLCRCKYPYLICRAIAAQFMSNDTIAIFEFQIENDEVKKVCEKHYMLAKSSDISIEEIIEYNNR